MMQDQEDIQKKAQEKTQKENMPNCYKDQPKRSHRKSASPNHIGDSYKLGKMASWLSLRESEITLVTDKENAMAEEIVCKDMEKVLSKKEDLLKFAEILYKCSLCTSIPCILTSESAFLRHVKEHHLAIQSAGNQCQHCNLHFQTFTDLQAHLSESHSAHEQENYVTFDDILGKSNNQQLTESENSSHPPSCRDNRENREAEEKIMADDQSDYDDQTPSAAEQMNSRQNTPRDDTEVDIKPQIPVHARPSPSTPLATLEYHSSAQHLPRLHVPSCPSVSPPLHPQQADPRRSPLFGGNIPEPFNGFPSFTPEFGRYTKLIREGGRIVYFCQVCNVKCQVKAAFQVHCNGVRHHNTVNMVGKNKARVSSPHASRDTCLRSPLKEVPLVTPQLMAVPKGDQSFIEKMTKFFHDNPDMSSFMNQGNNLPVGDIWGSPVNFSLKDRSGGKSDSVDSKSFEKDIRCPEKGHTMGRNFCLGNQSTSPNHQQGYALKESHEHCTPSTRMKSGNENAGMCGVPESVRDEVSDLSYSKSRKRPAPSTPCSDSPIVSETESAPVVRTSSMSSVRSDENDLCRDSTNSGIHDRSADHSSKKRPRMDIPHHHDGFKSQEPRSHEELLTTNVHCERDLKHSEASSSERRYNQQTESIQQSNQETGQILQQSDNRDEKRLQKSDRDIENCYEMENTVHVSEDGRGDSVPEENSSLPDRVSALRIRQHYTTKSVNQSTKNNADPRQEHGTDTPLTDSTQAPDTDPHRSSNSESDSGPQELQEMVQATVPRNPCGVESSTSGGGSHHGSSNITAQMSDHTLLDMLAKRQLSLEGGASFFPGTVSDAWFHHLPEAGKDLSCPALWRGGGAALHEPDDVTDSNKGQNSEGWKVTKIRDVLRGLIAASGKSSSVSRDMLLYQVSRVLHAPDVQHWGPACNRAVRDLFPHCLAQRKGKFKKTYFFGLALVPTLDETKGENHIHVDGTSFRPLRDMTQDLEQLLEHLPGLLYWSGQVERGVSRDAVLHVLAARLSEAEVFHWGMQCNKALRMLFPLVLMKRKGKYKTVYFGVDFTPAAQKLLPAIASGREQAPWQEFCGSISS